MPDVRGRPLTLWSPTAGDGLVHLEKPALPILGLPDGRFWLVCRTMSHLANPAAGPVTCWWCITGLKRYE